MYSFKPLVIRITIYSIVVLFLGYFSYITFTIPRNFPIGKNFIVEEGESLRSVSARLEKEGYIDYSLWFRAGVSFLGGDKNIQLGGYMFDRPRTLGYVVRKFVSGNPDTPLISVTIPEGSTTHEIAVLVHGVLPNIDISVFEYEVLKNKSNGKLFPSTYFLLPSMTEVRIVDKMTTTFDKKYLETFYDLPIPPEFKNKDEIISLAAILEGEAKTKEDMQIVAGILIKRLQKGMPLQVDAAPETYKIKWVPSIPINNPGLVALNAVFHPIDTPYLYYITGKDGTMHYSKTFEEHKINIKKYLK